MIKGHVTIDLHNHNSGFTERIEKENLVTDAIDVLLTAGLGGNMGVNNFAFPISTNGLGGIMLFNGTLEEEKSNIHFPMNVALVGHAGQSVNTSDPLRGSLNSAESGKIDNGYKTVWDFSTSQGNGMIYSLARTHAQGGDNPFQVKCNMYRGCIPTSTMYIPLYYDKDSQTMFFNYNGNGDIRKCDYPLYKYPLTYSAYSGLPYTIVCSDNRSGGFRRGYDGYFYNMTSYGNSNGSSYIKYVRAKVNDDLQSITIESEKTVSVPGVSFSLNTQPPFCKGYVYLRRMDCKAIYKVNLKNTSDVTEIEIPDGKTVDNMSPMYNGGIQFSAGGKLGFIYTDDTIQISKECTGAMYNYNLQTPCLTYEGYQNDSYGGGAYSCMVGNYLGTICNLQTPVEKTAATSMKVTYTLTHENV